MDHRFPQMQSSLPSPPQGTGPSSQTAPDTLEDSLDVTLAASDCVKCAYSGLFHGQTTSRLSAGALRVIHLHTVVATLARLQALPM